jgi:endonuclease-3 related protein
LAPKRKANAVRRYYRALYRAWGPQHWWPADTRFEVIVGAYLTQNTAWTNVERALANLRAAGLLNIDGIRRVKLSRLERLIQPSGYFRQKATRLKTFVAFLDKEHGASLDRLFSQATDKLREELLSLDGVGPETADSILLYAGNHPVFVVDAYTRRILARHEILPDKADYEDVRKLMERALAPLALEHGEETAVCRNQHVGTAAPGCPVERSSTSLRTKEAGPDPSARQPELGIRGAAHPPSAMSTANRTALVQIYNEMHGLLVGVGKHYCGKSQPKCDGCPLQRFLPRGKQ